MSAPQDIETVKRQVEAQLAEYEQAVADYAAFMADWRAHNQQPDPAAARAAAE